MSHVKKYLNWMLLIIISLTSCDSIKKVSFMETKKVEKGSFEFDLHFLHNFDKKLVVLKSENGNSQIIISPKYQSKVFTSTAENIAGKSFGWVNYNAFTSTPSKQMNAYGGENRFWLGPEGGQFSLYFNPGDKMDFPKWRTPASFDTESWSVKRKNKLEVVFQKEMSIINYKGTNLSILVDRKIRILTNAQISSELSVNLPNLLKAVGYETENKITNIGKFEWTYETGMPCIWMLDMFKPSQTTVVVVPFQKTNIDDFKTVATTNYFGEIQMDRLKHTDKVLYFKADGKQRTKLGIKPSKISPYAGSYDSASKVLTIIKFDTDSQAQFLNQEWNTTKEPFSGDAMNAYNDGPLEDGSQMGPFYEIESVSPAAFLKPRTSLTHKHAVFHLTGSDEDLSTVVQKIFGVSLDEIKKVF